MSDVDLNALETLLEVATPGPWELARTWAFGRTSEMDTIRNADGQAVIMPQDEQGGASWGDDADAELIVYLRNVAPALVAEVKRLRAVAEAASWVTRTDSKRSVDCATAEVNARALDSLRAALNALGDEKETVYRWSGVDRRGVHHSGVTTQPPDVFIEAKFKARWRGLLLNDGDGQVGAIVPAVMNNGRRTWWAESRSTPESHAYAVDAVDVALDALDAGGEGS